MYKWIVALFIVIVCVSCSNQNIETGEFVAPFESINSQVQTESKTIALSVSNNTIEKIRFNKIAFESRLNLLNEISRDNYGYAYKEYDSIKIIITRDLGQASGQMVTVGKTAEITINLEAVAIALTDPRYQLNMEEYTEAVILDELANLVSNDGPKANKFGDLDTAEYSPWLVSEIFSWGVYVASSSIVMNLEFEDEAENVYEFVYVKSLDIQPMPEVYSEKNLLGYQLTNEEFQKLFSTYNLGYIIAIDS